MNWTSRISGGAALSLLFAISAAAQNYKPPIEITNIRIGQGDATLIQGPRNSDGSRVNVLFDAGQTKGFKSGSAIRVVLERNGVGRIWKDGSVVDHVPLDYLIVSHDDYDHFGGTVAGGSHGNSFIFGHDDSVGCVGDDDNDGKSDWESVSVPDSRGSLKTRSTFYKPDADELGNCGDMRIGTVVDYGIENIRMSAQAHHKYKYLVEALVANGTEKISLNTQEKIDAYQIDLGQGATMDAYAGAGFVKRGNGKIAAADRPNELSLSFLVSYGDFDYLISGDLIGKFKDKDIEANRLEGKPLPSSTDAHMEYAVGKKVAEDRGKIEVVHINHHGADNASEARFLETINPDIAIISAGNGNSYKHPENTVLERLVDAGIYRIIQTSWGDPEGAVSAAVRERQAIFQGDVKITSYGYGYHVSTSRWFNSTTDYTPD